MKKLDILFKINGYCSMPLEVPDDYQIPSTNPEVLWEDLKNVAGDQIEADLLELDDYIRDDLQLFNININLLELDHFESVFLPGNDGDKIEIKLDRILFNQ